MAKFFDEITPELKEFIEAQKIFFVATAAADGRINLSPKGLADTFKVMDNKRVLWLNLTGSGNETAAHLLQNNRITVMFCSFEGKPLILRLYGTAKMYHERDKGFQDNIHLFPEIPGTRQIVDMTIESVQTSCGYAVPFMDFKEERQQLNSWAEKQGRERIENYWKEKNTKSIDGLETKILGD
ncbi:pyridoxamine 5'-phosphate oxidase family protein [Hyunsoonleella sp. SJ7]|uniref:Pyridoxamine 5'-phosphate oxidase family protein n=1 Tax=Hyunsoonleella aquatilis TaxID=2762758 RepID=A0A923KLY8_9FLAO|nr:pyridoxamine 5'-phosphate oxidase family protein [Hyunsoonleella aquatilis]MBC3759967.1 pyridoxamine 5'-phosphate oxidase family protein [Hyunsoonleella aquatilis]